MRDFNAAAPSTTYLQVVVRPINRIGNLRDCLSNGNSMFKALARCALFAFTLLPAASAAEPVTLKLAFFSSDRTTSYLAAVKPFIDAVNSEGAGIIDIVLYSGGALGRDLAQQPQVVLDGEADIAFVVPAYTPERFPDNAVVELPGLFRDTREATLVYTRLVALNALKGYDDFIVLGAYVTEPETIHSRAPITSIDDLKDKRIRVTNQIQAAAFRKLGALPAPMQITRIADAISNGTIDGAAVARTPLSDYGIKRLTTYHYFLGSSGAPLALLMSRKRFDSLPAAAQIIIRRYSGEWAAMRFIETHAITDEKVTQQLKSDPARQMIIPSHRDLEIADVAFKSAIGEWAAESPHNRELLTLTEAEIAKLRPAR